MCGESKIVPKHSRGLILKFPSMNSVDIRVITFEIT